MAIFDFENASIKGDPQWAEVSRWTAKAPIVVISLAVLCIVEIVLGSMWVASINDAHGVELNFGQVVQPLVVPGLSLFNTVPSFHLHVLARSNPPGMALTFSTLLALCFLISVVIFLAACPSGVKDNYAHASQQTSFQRTECPVGANGEVWGAMIGLQLVSCVGYILHAVMAWWVRHVQRRNRREEAAGTRMVVIDEEQKRREEELARERWRMIRDL